MAWYSNFRQSILKQAQKKNPDIMLDYSLIPMKIHVNKKNTLYAYTQDQPVWLIMCLCILSLKIRCEQGKYSGDFLKVDVNTKDGHTCEEKNVSSSQHET